MNKNLQRLVFIFSFLTLSQFVIADVKDQDTYSVKGQVLSSDDNAPLPGVTVVLKDNPTTGSVSDLDGNFSIRVSNDDILVFSYVGFQTKEEAVNGRTEINISLDLDIESLDEVVIVGYGEQKKANLTGAITSVKPEEIEDIPVGNLSTALIGKMPGVQINRNGTGIPGTDTQLVIRDEASSGTERQVLYVIDGFVYNNDANGNTGPAGSEIFNRLDPSEIESITILKDAAAAVYGARGAGGVVLVKTKRGSIGKPRVSYNGSFGIGQATVVPEMLSAYDHATMLDDIKRLQGVTRASSFYAPDELEEFKNRDYNWVDGLYKNAVTSRHAFNVSGGTESVRYFVGGSYYLETGNYDQMWFKKYGVRSNLEADVSKDVKVGIGINYSQGGNRKPYYAYDSQPGVLRDWYGRLLTAPKWQKPVVDGLPTEISGSWNPYGLMDSKNFTGGSSNNTNLSATMDYSVPWVKGLKLSARYAYNINTSTSDRFAQDYTVYKFKYTGTYLNIPTEELASDPENTIGNKEGIIQGSGRGLNYQLNTTINYTNSFGKHNVTATLVYEQTEGQTRDFTVNKYISDIKGVNQLWAFSNTGLLVTGTSYESGRYSYIGRFNYDYEGKYIFESTFRREASNKFAPKYAKGIFPSVAVGWVLSEEGFIKNNLSFVDFLKMRFSLGIVGNDNVRPYEWKQSYIGNQTGALFGTGDGTLTNAIEARNQGVVVPTRTWSKTNSYNFGIDFSTLNQKIGFSIDYYYAFTYDGFIKRSNIPYETGATSLPMENYKESFSEGIEVLLSYDDKIGTDFNYSVSSNFAWRHSRPTKLYQSDAVIGTWKDETKNDDSNQPGYKALGIIRTDEDLEKVKAMYPTIFGQTIQKGMVYYKDVGGPDYSRGPDGVLDSWDQTIIAKYTTAPYSYGLSLSGSWKGLRLSANFNGIFGHKEFVEKDEQELPTKTSNVFAWQGDYWSEENPNAKMPIPVLGNTGYLGTGFTDPQISTFWMRNGHTLRLNNVSLSYAIPQEITQRYKVPKVRVYCAVTNVWTIISPFDWKDPLVSRAYDYPLVRTVSLGLNVNF